MGSDTMTGLNSDTDTDSDVESSGRLELFRRAKLVLWDEAMICHGHALEAFDRIIRDNRDCNLPFGGVGFVNLYDVKVILHFVPSKALQCR